MTDKSAKQLKLEDDEKALLDSVESGEWQSVKKPDKYLKRASKASTNFLKKNARINIRISSFDLQHLKRLAAREGMPYQTFIASVLHKYASKHIERE